MSETAREFVSACLTIDPASRPTAAEALQHKWLASEQPHFVPDPESASGRPTNLLPNIRKAFDAKKTCMSIYIPYFTFPSSARSLASLPRNNFHCSCPFASIRPLLLFLSLPSPLPRVCDADC